MFFHHTAIKWLKIAALVLFMLLALIFCAGAVIRDAAMGGAVPGTVTLYDVQRVNSRLRSMETSRVDLLSGTRSDQALQAAVTADPDLTYDAVDLGDIPLLEVYVDDGTEKPLLLFLHGVAKNKESVLAALSAFASAGYYAVSMDAYDQGSRQDPELVCDNWAAMLITVADIDQVVEYYDMKTGVRVRDFVLGGFSMGAIETWVYAQLGGYEPGALLPMAGMCQEEVWMPGRFEGLLTSWLEQRDWGVALFREEQSDDYTQDKYEAVVALDIEKNLDSFTGIPIFCGVGTEDHFFSSDAAGKVMEAISRAGNDQAVFRAYQGAAHMLTEEMVADCVAFLQTLEGEND